MGASASFQVSLTQSYTIPYGSLLCGLLPHIPKMYDYSMVAKVTPTNEEHQAHLLELVERVEEEDRPAMLKHYSKYYTYEKYCWEQNRLRNEILEIVKNNMYGPDCSTVEDFENIVDEMSDEVAELIINLSSHAEELETNLQEFYDIDMPEVWAI